jgi:hypothetical protein
MHATKAANHKAAMLPLIRLYHPSRPPEETTGDVSRGTYRQYQRTLDFQERRGVQA